MIKKFLDIPIIIFTYGICCTWKYLPSEFVLTIDNKSFDGDILLK